MGKLELSVPGKRQMVAVQFYCKIEEMAFLALISLRLTWPRFICFSPSLTNGCAELSAKGWVCTAHP